MTRGVTLAAMAVAACCGVVVAGAVRSDAVILPPDTPSPASGWLRSFLANFTLDLGGVDLKNIKFNISFVTCKGVTVGPLSSTFAPPTAIDVAVTNTTTHCSGEWEHEHLITHKRTSGPLSVGVHGNLVKFNVNLLKNASTQLITGARATGCDVSADLTVGFGPKESGIEKDVVAAIIDLAKKQVNSTLCEAIASVVENKLGGGINNLSVALAPWMAPVTPAPAAPVPNQGDMIDLRTSPTAAFLNYMASDALGARGLDGLVNVLIPGGLLSTGVEAGWNTTVRFDNVTVVVGVACVNASGLSSLTRFDAVAATGPHTIRTKVDVDNFELSLAGFFEAWPSPHGAGPPTGYPAVQWFEATVRVANVTLAIDTELVVHASRMSTLRGVQVLNESCFAWTLGEWNTTFLDLQARAPNTSSVVVRGGNVDADVDALLTQISAITVDSLEPVIPAVLRGWLNGPARERLNRARAELIGNGTCEGVAPRPRNLPPDAAAATVAGNVALAVAAVVAVVRLESARPGAPVLANRAVPLALRVAIAVLLIATLGIFVIGMLAHGGAVTLTLTVDGHVDAELPPLYYLSLYGSVRDSWRSGAIGLAVFIGVTNLVGPALRVATLLAVCTVPGVPMRVRRAAAVSCDLLGKWVLAQSIVAVEMMIAFKYAVVFKDAPTSASADIFLIFDWWGWWGIMTCAALGLVSSHLVLHALDLAHGDAADAADADGAEWLAKKPADTGAGAYKTRIAPVSTPARIGVAFALAASVGAVAIGSTLPAFVFEYEGMTRALDVATETPYTRDFSFWSMVRAMPDPKHVGHDANMAFLQFVFVAAIIVMPVVQGLGALALWTMPMTVAARRRASWVLQTVSAWSSLDVFVLSVVLGFLQISLFATFIVGDKCDVLKPLLHAPDVEKALHGDPKCLDVKATLLAPGLLALGLPAVLINLFSLHIVERSRHTAGVGVGGVGGGGGVRATAEAAGGRRGVGEEALLLTPRRGGIQDGDDF